MIHVLAVVDRSTRIVTEEMLKDVGGHYLWLPFAFLV
jgi:hypothetical protein